MYNVQLIHSFHCFEFIELTLSYVYFLVFLITCCRIIWISHLQIPCCNKGCDVTLTVLCLIG